jgi:hypothetical protein
MEAPVLYRRFYGLDSAKDLAGFRIASLVNEVARNQATALRDRAARCRQLAATFYDQRIISELEAYASELEVDARRLEAGNRSFRRTSAG